MIPFKKALQNVLECSASFGEEKVILSQATGRILAENIYADRDFPPFNRATKDGIAINYKCLEKGQLTFQISAIAAAGSPQKELTPMDSAIEIMTGAVVPKNADTVVMYEHLELNNGAVSLKKPVVKGQNIHNKGSDEQKGATVLNKGVRITAAEIGILASVGKTEVLVKVLPKICLVSTGDELVSIDKIPKAHQIRKSNSYTLSAALLKEHIKADAIHIKDDKKSTRTALLSALNQYDVLLLSGGVSKGKYDYLPEIFEEIGVEKVFHKVKQRPGKPFWFGRHVVDETTIFAFPGNPASTFASYHIYFLSWLHACLGLSTSEITVILKESFDNKTDLTRFIRAKSSIKSGKLEAELIHGNGSGDLTSLSKANGFILLEPNKTYKKGSSVPFISTRSIF